MLFIVALGRQQDRLRLHAAVGLLRVRLDDHLALEHAGRLVGDDMPVEFAALAARRGVDDLERRVGVAASVEQAEAAEPDFAPVADEPDENLPAHQRAAGDEARTRRAPRRSASRTTWLSTCRPGSSSIDGDMRKRLAPSPSSMPVEALRCVVRARADEAFDERARCAPAPTSIATRE